VLTHNHTLKRAPVQYTDMDHGSADKDPTQSAIDKDHFNTIKTDPPSTVHMLGHA